MGEDAGVDLSQFYDTFFDEAEELLADMERLLLGLDIASPQEDDLNAIFRAAHSIKGGAATFGTFEALAHTTHLLENILDRVRHRDMALSQSMIDTFLRVKDVLADQVSAYRAGGSPDEQAYAEICQLLEGLRQESSASDQVAAEPPVSVTNEASPKTRTAGRLRIALDDIGGADFKALLNEMTLMGEIREQEHRDKKALIVLETTETPETIEAVCCFVVDVSQLHVSRESQASPEDRPTVPVGPGISAPSGEPTQRKPAEHAPAPRKESATIRVGIEKVDQIINQVGELVITQAMLGQAALGLDPVLHSRLIAGIEQLERNARDLQESVMSVRMMPMDYVFNRFPRVVRENAAKLGKRIRLETEGEATELDKGLIERIIDPLTHLVRNSLDHGIETPEVREAAGKDPEGCIRLSAQHSGGQIIIEVTDDGAGLNRERILAKAQSQGLAVSENAPDEEIWALIFAPGFSTAEKITDISGRGVGMDVVRRNIQDLGGQIQLSSRAGEGTVMRIALPLTLAILDGMLVQVGEETFILPLSHVTESIQPAPDQIHAITQAEHVFFMRGEYLPLVSLAKVFSVEATQSDPTKSIAVVLQAGESRFALLVDQLIGQHQVVVKNLETNYRKVPGISAATILGDGSVALILDVFALTRMAHETSDCLTEEMNLVR